MASAKQAKVESEVHKSETEAEAETQGQGAAPKKHFISRKLIIIVAAILLMLGGGGSSGYLYFLSNKTHEEKHAPVTAKPPTFVNVPEILVNLSSVGNDRAQYLKAQIVLEVSDPKIAEEIKPILPRVLDVFNTFLREMRSTDLEGSAGLYRLRDELTRRVNLAIAPSKINAVLFKEIIVK